VHAASASQNKILTALCVPPQNSRETALSMAINFDPLLANKIDPPLLV